MSVLSIPFKEQLMPFEPGSSWQKFRGFSRSGLVPCLHDGDTVVWDSLAITEYLAERHAGVWPEDSGARAWARCVTCEMHSGFFALRGQCPMNCGVRVELREIGSSLQANLDRLDEIWSEGLERFGGPFLSGRNFTAADAFFVPVAFRVQTYNLPLAKVSRDYAETLLDLPAAQEWYEAALKEPWREQHHEDEISGVGQVQMDFRQA
jgi:glutathione S-transferase